MMIPMRAVEIRTIESGTLLMHAFVTVGSTRFDDLVECAFSPAFLSSLHRKGYRQLVVQCGSSTFGNGKLFEGEGSFMTEISGIRIECWKYKPSLKQDFKRADLVISHAGALLIC